MPKHVKVKTKGDQLRGEGVVKLVAEYQQVRGVREMWAKKEAEIKSRLESVVEHRGTLDDKGHLWLDLPEEVDGVTRLQKQKRVSQVVNESVAEVELKRLKLWDRCTTQVTVIDEDEILALAFQKKIPEDVMAEIIEEKTSYAFYLR